MRDENRGTGFLLVFSQVKNSMRRIGTLTECPTEVTHCETMCNVRGESRVLGPFKNFLFCKEAFFLHKRFCDYEALEFSILYLNIYGMLYRDLIFKPILGLFRVNKLKVMEKNLLKNLKLLKKCAYISQS